MRTAINNQWGMVKKPAFWAFVVWAIVIALTAFFATFLLAGQLYAEKKFALAAIIAAVLSLVATTVQIVGWYRSQPPPRQDLPTIRKAWREPIVGVAMHYSAILIGISLGGLILSRNCPESIICCTYSILVLVQQIVLTGATCWMFGERLRKRIPPRQPNQPAVARKEDKQMPVVLALLALLAVVVAVLTVFVGAKKGNRRRRR